MGTGVTHWCCYGISAMYITDLRGRSGHASRATLAWGVSRAACFGLGREPGHRFGHLSLRKAAERVVELHAIARPPTAKGPLGVPSSTSQGQARPYDTKIGLGWLFHWPDQAEQAARRRCPGPLRFPYMCLCAFKCSSTKRGSNKRSGIGAVPRYRICTNTPRPRKPRAWLFGGLVCTLAAPGMSAAHCDSF